MPKGTLRRIAAATSILAGLAAAFAWSGVANAGPTLDRIRGASTLKLGYNPDARPFSFKTDKDKPDGYAIALCDKVAEGVKADLKLTQFTVQWVPLAADKGPQAVADGSVDLFCGGAETLTRRQQVSFSIPIFPSGTGVMLNSSTPTVLRELLEYGKPSSDRPIWRGSPARTILQNTTFSSVAGTPTEQWLVERVKTLDLPTTLASVANYQEGVQRVLDGSSSGLFGDISVLMNASARSRMGDLVVLKRYFTYQPIGMALSRGDEDFRLTVDRALSQMYASEDFGAFFTTWFGPPDESTVTFFRQTALPN